MKYFLYARKSSEGEDKQIASIDAQIKELNTIAERSGIEIVEVFEESKSAKSPNNRPKFNEMIGRLHKGEAQGILCWKLDRLARNPVDGGTVSWMLQSGLIQEIRTYDKSYLPTDNVLMMQVEFGVANQFIIDLRSNTKRGLRAKAEKGVFPGRAPLGYLNDMFQKKGEKGIVIDKIKFPIIRKLWDMILTGEYTISDLHIIARDDYQLTGITGKPIAKSVVYNIFTNPFYYGSFRYTQKLWKGSHKPMITKEEFHLTQQILSSRGAKSKGGKYYFPFTKLIECDECGGMITAEHKKKKQKNGNVHEYDYYRCTKRKGLPCSQKCVRAEELESQIETLLSEIDIPKEFTQWAFEVIREKHEQEKFLQKAQLKTLQDRHDQVTFKLNNLVDLRLSAEITPEEFKSQRERLETEKSHVKELLADFDQRVDTWIDTAEKEFRFSETARERFNTADEPTKRNILSHIGTKFTLVDGELKVDMREIFTKVRTASKVTKRLHRTFEPVESVVLQGQYAQLYASSPVLGGHRESNPDCRYHKPE